MRCIPYHNRGVTLIELIASMVIMALSLSVMVMMVVMLTQRGVHEARLLEGLNLLEFYQSQASHWQGKDCLQSQTELAMFLCDRDAKQVTLKPEGSEATLVITKQIGTVQMLEYHLTMDTKTSLRSKQWVAL